MSDTAVERSSVNAADEDGRRERPVERADRNMLEMLQELRVAQTGVQILFAFLLSLTFTERFGRIDEFQRWTYVVTLLLTLLTTGLLVAPAARGHGLGRRLVEQCVAFARAAGYRRLVLWTNDPLVAARRLYLDAGFVLTDAERHREFGVELLGQSYELDLTRPDAP